MAQVSTPTTLQCLQVWGGTEIADQELKLTGLDSYLYSRPHQGATRGGDVYFLSTCSSGRISRVLLCDVAGHGSQVADAAQDLRWLMQRYVNYTSQQTFMDAMNKKYLEMSETGKFATAIAMSFFSPTRKLSLSNAGHPPPLWYRKRDQQWYILGVDPGDTYSTDLANLPFGISDEVGYKQIDIQFDPDDLLLMYTDALTEARGSDGRMLGVRGLLKRVSSFDPNQPKRLIAELIERITLEDPDDLGGDDVTALLVQATGKKHNWMQMVTSPYHAVCGVFKGSPLDLGIAR